MRYEWGNNAVLFLHNLCSKAKKVRFSLCGKGEDGCALVNLLSENHSHPEDGDRHCILLEPYGYRWYRTCGLDYLLVRSNA